MNLSNKKKIIFSILSITIFVIVICPQIYAEDCLKYKIKNGDNLTNIAEKFSVSMDSIIKLNAIKNPDLIAAGRVIKIVKEKIYIVKIGDTLSKIANNLSIKLTELIKINKIANPDHIIPGQKLLLPDNQSYYRKDKIYTVMSRNNNLSFLWPVQGGITSKYGNRIHPIYKEKHFHTGIDIAVPLGSPVYAAESGIISYSGWSSGYGYLIKIKHRKAMSTYYAHNLSLLVKPGQKVRKGKIIALSGSSGVSTGPHLHFEIRINGNHVNPINYLNQKYLRSNFRL